jgi:hypothetical protein
VTDDRHVLGPCLDYQILRVPSRDGFENRLISLFSAKVGDTFLRFVKFSFPVIGGIEVCRVRVFPSSEPVFVTENGQEHLPPLLAVGYDEVHHEALAVKTRSLLLDLYDPP